MWILEVCRFSEILNWKQKMENYGIVVAAIRTKAGWWWIGWKAKSAWPTRAHALGASTGTVTARCPRTRRHGGTPAESYEVVSIQSQHSLKWNGVMKYLSSTRGLSTTRVYRSLYLGLAIVVILQILTRLSTAIRKVFIIQLRFQLTPINLMHNHS
jgi:hypothetical protein